MDQYPSIDFAQKNIIIVSPHPDDELFIGGTIMKALEEGASIYVWYCTNGTGGLPVDSSPNLRKIEATNAMAKLSLSNNKVNLIFLDLPFYQTKERIVSDKDIQVLRKSFEKIKPDIMFVCSDLDPRGTHMKCNTLSVNLALNYDYCDIYRYIGAWEPMLSWKPNRLVKVDESHLPSIYSAWDCYKSQVNLLVNSNDSRTLKERYSDLIQDGEYFQKI
jgi:LmbE family N-acetylglucosaminyl deacetylase